MGLRINKRSKAPPQPVTITSHKDFKSQLLRDALVKRIRRLDRLVSLQQNEIDARYREVAARYQEVVELRWACLKAQCMEQARTLFGVHLSHVGYDAVVWGVDGIRDGVDVREEDATFVVSIHCLDRQASRRSNSSISSPPPPPPPGVGTLPSLPSREQQEYELELLDGCLAASLQRPTWMPRHLVLEMFDWQSGGGSGGDGNSGTTATSRIPPPYVSRRRAEFCRGSFDACSAMQKQVQVLPSEVAKVSADTAFVFDDDVGEESQEEEEEEEEAAAAAE